MEVVLCTPLVGDLVYDGTLCLVYEEPLLDGVSPPDWASRRSVLRTPMTRAAIQAFDT